MTPADKANEQAAEARLGFVLSQIVGGYGAIRAHSQQTVTDIWDAIGREAVAAGLTPRQQRLAVNRLAKLHDTIEPIIVKTEGYVAKVVKGEYRISFYEQAFSTQYLGFRGSLGKPSDEVLLKRFTTFPSVYIDTKLTNRRVTQVNQVVDRAILSSLNRGYSVEQTAKVVDVVLGFRTSSGELTAKGRDMLNQGQRATPKGEIYKTIRIARTEMGRMRSWAQIDATQRAIVKGFDQRLQYMATLDDRTRSQSASMHLQVSNEELKFRYPDGNYYYQKMTGNPRWDINDRCTTVPYIDDIDLEKYATQTLPTGETVTAEFRTWNEFAVANNLTVNRYHEKMPELRV